MTMRSLMPLSWNRPMMSEARRDPFALLRQDMERLFDNWGNFSSDLTASDVTPRLDVCETDKEIDIDAELPGVDSKDVDINLSGNVLTIRGERKNGQEEKGRNYYLSERSYGSFTRSITLPFEADPKNVRADFRNGVLHIAVQKPTEITGKAAKIPIRAN